MFRDQFKEEQYFREATKTLTATLDAKRKELLSKTQPFPMEYYVMANGLYIYIYWAYSLGQPVRTLVAPCKEMLDDYVLSIETEADYSDGGDIIYSELLGMISIGVLLDTKESLQKLGDILARIGYKDYLVSFLLRYGQPGYELPGELLWPEDAGCVKLKEITQSGKADAAAGLYEYLQKNFYTRDNLEDLYGSHKKSGNFYRGYWSFESAAIAKVMNLDDSKLKTSPYYPYDMLHGDPSGATEGPAEPPPSPDKNHAEDAAPGAKKKWWQF
ncbi:PoNe immunity protein domain-containing protein [Chitinophaga barathri]|uniref:DUF1911 domain-containing protein n=1 Tax=Chitinophaga barathri TaxID=1647451 RepID=A0A3N4MGV1_9BACT|nr:PoNe immunity protein domain-containing protein [Chitinophaga barathri]RPD43282.1 DUF1911 domain-containing protein [Chitinophaga barathri]